MIGLLSVIIASPVACPIQQATVLVTLLDMDNATQIFAAVAAVLASLYPNIPAVPVIQRKGRAGPKPEQATAGYTLGVGPPGFIVSMEEAEEVDDDIPSFEEVAVAYRVEIGYVKAAYADPGLWVEDPEIRTMRTAIRQAFYMPALGAISAIADVKTAAGKPYETLEGTIVHGLWTFTWTCTEPRPDLA